MKKWTMPDGKTRAASQGPWIASSDIQTFVTFCERIGHKTRTFPHSGVGRGGYQVQHDGHWMALLWNNSFKRYTADRRLSLIVQSFATEQAAPRKTLVLQDGKVVAKPGVE